MNDTTQAKATRTRAFVRSYDYANFTGAIKDAATNLPVVEFDLSTLPENVRNKLALSGLMALTAGAMVEAHKDGENAAKAGQEVVSELVADKIEFRDGVGISMGGAIKRVARAVTELGYSNLKAPDGSTISWTKGDLSSAYAALKDLWNMAASKEGATPAYESGKARFNKIKSSPEVMTKLLQYSKKSSGVELS